MENQAKGMNSLSELEEIQIMMNIWNKPNITNQLNELKLNIIFPFVSLAIWTFNKVYEDVEKWGDANYAGINV